MFKQFFLFRDFSGCLQSVCTVLSNIFQRWDYEGEKGASLDLDFALGSPLSRASEQISEFNQALRCDENLDINHQQEPVFHAH